MLKGALPLIVVMSVWPIVVILVAISPFSRSVLGFLFSDLADHYVSDSGYQLAETAKAKVQDHYPRGCFRNLRVA